MADGRATSPELCDTRQQRDLRGLIERWDGAALRRSALAWAPGALARLCATAVSASRVTSSSEGYRPIMSS